jgi:regulator of RNase E activity RraA
MTNIGFRILQVKNRPRTELITKYRSLSTALISDSMNRSFGTGLKPYHKGGRLSGSAFTVKTRPGDNLMIHKAIDLAERGDVIVVDAGGELSQALIGEIMVKLACKKGIEGFVIDGAIRDSGIIGKGTYPIYAKGVTHRGPYKDGPGEINVPISINGMVVNPGDIIIGDEDGVIAVPINDAAEILKRALTQQMYELNVLTSIDDGTIDRSWVDEILQIKGY